MMWYTFKVLSCTNFHKQEKAIIYVHEYGTYMTLSINMVCDGCRDSRKHYTENTPSVITSLMHMKGTCTHAL